MHQAALFRNFITTLLSFMLFQAACADVWISEFMASNDTTLNDSDGDSSDWIELYNDGATSVNLAGWHLTDNAGELAKWTFPTVTIPAKGYLVVFASKKDRRTEGQELHTNFSLKKSGEYLALVRPDGTTVEHAYSPSYPAQVTDVSYGLSQSGAISTFLPMGSVGRAGVASSLADFNTHFTGWNTSLNGTFTGSTWRAVNSGVGYERNSGYDSWIGTGGDFESDMYNKNASIFLRLHFTLNDPTTLQSLSLRMRWDAGFVAYINGVQVASDRAPATLAWDSSATSDRLDNQNDDWETFSIDLSALTLNAGDNLLAIHGLNDRVGSSDMLCLPELDAIANPVTGTSLVYFSAPSPGSPNATGNTSIPPLVNDVTDAIDPLPTGGTGSQPLLITAQITETDHAISVVRLYYRIMFDPKIELTMKDDGVAPDAVAGDGIYSVYVPTTALSPGEMIRWRVEVEDDQGNMSQAPPYADPDDSDRYYGTIAADPSLSTSQLPVLHWFVENPSAANTAGGTRASYFFLGRFYSNIQVDRHGQSTSAFAKKSYDIDFNKGNRFKWKEGEKKVKDINLLTNWADKTKMRNTLAYEVFRDAGAPYHFAFPVRVQQNGAFFSVADMMEDGDDRFLKRNGLDGDGALYKIYNRLDSTNGAVKKTRKYEDDSDLEALITNLNEGNSQDSRRLYGYDNINIPATVNYLAGLVLASSQDQGHKNYYVYRDTNNTGEWMPIAWDVDLSFGHDWSNSQRYFDDDFVTDNDLQLGFSNRLKTLIWDSPELNAMFVRRVRTLMDQLLQPSSTPLAQRKMETRVNELADLIDPIGVISDADLDFSKWGSWKDGGGSSTAPSNKLRPQADRLLNDFFPNRRAYLYGGTPSCNGLGIPPAQTAQPNITIEDIEFMPSDQTQEYFILKNREAEAIDISGWQIKGAVEMTFASGTVIPAGGGDAASQYIGLLHVAKSAAAFRSRTSGPTSGQYRFIQGGYSGQLSARGETIELWDAEGNLIDTRTYAGTPTPAQLALRITEINYHPADPSPAELAQIPGVTSSDFEFIELLNTGGVSLTLDGARFIEGITYAFPPGTTLPAGSRIVLVKNIAAFELRYGAGLNVIGPYSGLLDNGGERLKLVDANGEEILDFSWNDKWYPPSDGGGRTLVLRDTATAFNDFDQPESWGISTMDHGSPASPDPSYQVHFQGWRYSLFSKSERDDPLIGMADSDPDHDGLTNWAEYCFGTNALVDDTPDNSLLSGTDGNYSMEFTRRANAYDILWEMEKSSDLEVWNTESSTPQGSPQSLPGGLERILLRSSTPLTTTGKQFFRIHATEILP